MITEDYVSFEIAKLLKEKGFVEPCDNYYDKNGSEKQEPQELTWNEIMYSFNEFLKAPTHQMAMKWLREKYNIYISIQPDFPSDKDYKMCWCWSVSILYENCINMKANQCYMKIYEEAVEAAIKYCLENLI